MRKGEKLDRINLSPDEYKQLLAAEKTQRDSKVYRRIQAFKMLHNGHLNKEVAEFFSVDINTVSYWIALYRDGGLGSLLSFDYKGRPQKLNNEQILQLRDEASKGSFETSKDICIYIKENFGIEFRDDYVPKLAKRIGLSYPKTKAVSRKKSAEKVKELIERDKRISKRSDSQR
jgi:transposase